MQLAWRALDSEKLSFKLKTTVTRRHPKLWLYTKYWLSSQQDDRAMITGMMQCTENLTKSKCAAFEIGLCKRTYRHIHTLMTSHPRWSRNRPNHTLSSVICTGLIGLEGRGLTRSKKRWRNYRIFPNLSVLINFYSYNSPSRRPDRRTPLLGRRRLQLFRASREPLLCWQLLLQSDWPRTYIYAYAAVIGRHSGTNKCRKLRKLLYRQSLQSAAVEQQNRRPRLNSWGL